VMPEKEERNEERNDGESRIVSPKPARRNAIAVNVGVKQGRTDAADQGIQGVADSPVSGNQEPEG